MASDFGRFAASPLGAGLAVADSGLSLSSTGTLAGKARSDIGLSAGVAGAEFVITGAVALSATVGVCTASALATNEVTAASGAGWRLHTGQVLIGGTVVASGLPAVSMGEVVAVRVSLDGSRRIAFYKGTTQVYEGALSLAGVLHFALSLNTGLRAFVNAGQWQGMSPAINGAGWPAPRISVAPVRVASEHFMSAPTDSPANTPFAGIVGGDGLTVVASVAFWPWDASSRAGSAALRLQDADGLLDVAALGDVRDVPVQIHMGVQGAPLATARSIARFVLERIDIEDDGRKTAVLRDPHDDLDRALHRAVFLPTVSDQLAWQAQPVIIGAVRSAQGIPVNSDGSVLWLGDGALASIGQVLDRGAAITPGTGYNLVSGGQQLAMTSPPLGPVVVDASTQAAMAPAKLEQLLRELFRRINKSAWSSADAAAIDAASGYAGTGYYSAGGATARQALADILPSYCADWWPDGDGVLRLARLIDPDTVADGQLAFDLNWQELSGDLSAAPDLAPNLTRRMAYQPNGVVLTSGDLITDMTQLPAEVRQQLTGQFRGQVYGGGQLAGRYARAEAAEPILSRFDQRADAQAEIDRVVALYSLPRNFYTGRLSGRTDVTFRPGQVGRITYPRYGLQAGRKVIVASVSYNPVLGQHAVKFWGA